MDTTSKTELNSNGSFFFFFSLYKLCVTRNTTHIYENKHAYMLFFVFFFIFCNEEEWCITAIVPNMQLH